MTEKLNFKKIIFYMFVRPLIRRNYKLRIRHKKSDKWYWLDKMTLGWGFSVMEQSEIESFRNGRYR